jgi:hypothetical protein
MPSLWRILARYYALSIKGKQGRGPLATNRATKRLNPAPEGATNRDQPLRLCAVLLLAIDFIEPDDPDDNCYVVLHGDDGEVVGPLTIEHAQTWIDQFRLTNCRCR